MSIPQSKPNMSMEIMDYEQKLTTTLTPTWTRYYINDVDIRSWILQLKFTTDQAHPGFLPGDDDWGKGAGSPLNVSLYVNSEGDARLECMISGDPQTGEVGSIDYVMANDPPFSMDYNFASQEDRDSFEPMFRHKIAGHNHIAVDKMQQLIDRYFGLNKFDIVQWFIPEQ